MQSQAEAGEELLGLSEAEAAEKLNRHKTGGKKAMEACDGDSVNYKHNGCQRNHADDRMQMTDVADDVQPQHSPKRCLYRTPCKT